MAARDEVDQVSRGIDVPRADDFHEAIVTRECATTLALPQLRERCITADTTSVTVMEGPSGSSRARFREVDGLKGLAVAAVVAYQIFRFSGFPANAPAAVARVFSDMSQGLGLFLTIAAFLFAYPLLAALHAEGSSTLDTGRYLSGRAIRVYPAYLAVALLAALLHPLGALFGYPALAHAAPPIDVGQYARNAVFAAGGLGNDGLRAVGLFALAYGLLPILLTLWTRLPRLAAYLAIVAAILDTLTRAHGFGIGIVVPLVLGIAAADVRVREHRSQRFGLAIAAAATVLAFALEPQIAALPGALQAPGALRIDPLWSLAFFGILVACGARPKLRLALGFIAFRVASAPAYVATLVAMPIAEFAARQMPPQLGSLQAALVTAAFIIVVAYALWQCLDRACASETFRQRAAGRPGAILDRVLERARIATVTFRFPPPKPVAAPEPDDASDARAAEMPPVPQAELARLSTRTGSPEDLAAEVFETKKRLTERTSEAGDFDASLPPLPAAFPPRHAPLPAPRPVVVTDVPASEPIVEMPAIETTVVEAPVVEATVVEEPVIAYAPLEDARQAPEPETAAPLEIGEPALVAAGAHHDFVSAKATRVLEQRTVAALAALVESVEAARELEPVVTRPAIRMRIGPPRAQSTETPEN
jgi:peptidoglycan/LPS O-acetylase OafA/YrhL